MCIFVQKSCWLNYTYKRKPWRSRGEGFGVKAPLILLPDDEWSASFPAVSRRTEDWLVLGPSPGASEKIISTLPARNRRLWGCWEGESIKTLWEFSAISPYSFLFLTMNDWKVVLQCVPYSLHYWTSHTYIHRTTWRAVIQFSSTTLHY